MMNDTDELERIRNTWDKRYKTKGHDFGDEPSMTAEMLADKLDPVSKVLEVGFGYGRDLLFMAQNGHLLHGVELAESGLSEARKFLSKYNLNSRVQLMDGDFSRLELRESAFDAVYAHRMLHLLGQNGLVRAFVNKAAYVLKPGGLLYVSARDERDFDPKEMRELPDGRVEYKAPEREGQLISLWNEHRFSREVERKFEVSGFVLGEELESVGTNKNTHFTVFTARNKKKQNSPAP